MARLTAGVLVRHPATGALAFLPVGSTLPGWASGLVGEHVLDGAAPTAPAETPAPVVVPERERDPVAVDEGEHPSTATGGTPAPPPRAGRGATAVGWRDWAGQVGLEVDPDASRDSVIAAAVDAGLVEP